MKFILAWFCFLVFLAGVAGGMGSRPPQDVPGMLKYAKELKYAEKYEEALKYYDKVLSQDPENKEALQGRDDCQIMLEPVIMEQMLMPVFVPGDKELIELQKRLQEAKTPWDKKRAERALDRYGMKYTGEVYARDRAKAESRVEKILERAKQRIKSGESAKAVKTQTRQELEVLQDEVNRSWKGQGPRILDTALKKLDRI